MEKLHLHEQTKAYAERSKAEGLSNKAILRCLKRSVHRPRGVRSADGQATQTKSGKLRRDASIIQAPIQSEDRHPKSVVGLGLDQSRQRKPESADKSKAPGLGKSSPGPASRRMIRAFTAKASQGLA